MARNLWSRVVIFQLAQKYRPEFVPWSVIAQVPIYAVIIKPTSIYPFHQVDVYRQPVARVPHPVLVYLQPVG